MLAHWWKLLQLTQLTDMIMKISWGYFLHCWPSVQWCCQSSGFTTQRLSNGDLISCLQYIYGDYCGSHNLLTWWGNVIGTLSTLLTVCVVKLPLSWIHYTEGQYPARGISSQSSYTFTRITRGPTFTGIKIESSEWMLHFTDPSVQQIHWSGVFTALTLIRESDSKLTLLLLFRSERSEALRTKKQQEGQIWIRLWLESL